ncbi:MAG: hypothetical protein PHV13_02415 [Candidatus ainarchaeum sp.]|nr:hypothetical protein [Candidatus ainarchaeum sp.]
MQRMARPPPQENVQKAIEWSKGNPGSLVRILTMSNDTQRAVVLYRAQSQGQECPHYYDVELDRASTMAEYANLGKGSIVGSAPYTESEYRKSQAAFERYKVLAEGGMIVQ